MKERSKLVRALLRVVRPVWRIRGLALLSELVFWDRWLARRVAGGPAGSALPEAHAFPEALARLVGHVAGRPVKVLEVGAGLAASVGAQHRALDVDVVATDVLAAQYRRILRRRGLRPANPTIHADAEALTPQFGRDAFDLVYAANCIDHTRDALRAIREMVAVVRPGGYVVMDHFENEGAQQDYAGLHEWNLCANGGRFELWNERARHDVAAALGPGCEVRAASSDGLLHVEIRKLPGAALQ